MFHVRCGERNRYYLNSVLLLDSWVLRMFLGERGGDELFQKSDDWALERCSNLPVNWLWMVIQLVNGKAGIENYEHPEHNSDCTYLLILPVPVLPPIMVFCKYEESCRWKVLLTFEFRLTKNPCFMILMLWPLRLLSLEFTIHHVLVEAFYQFFFFPHTLRIGWYFIPFYSWEGWDAKRLRNLCKVTAD